VRNKVSSFNWDKGNFQKVQKHGLSVQEIEDFFLSEPHLIEDKKHSEKEPRFIAVGDYKGRYLLVAFTLRIIDGELCIRPISARYARDKEVRKYGQTKKKN
jgi:uncharacterized protein